MLEKIGLSLVKAARHTLAAFVAFALLIAWLNEKTTGLSNQIVASIGGLCLLLMIYFMGKNWVNPSEAKTIAMTDPLWGPEHQPLVQDQVKIWIGKWRCQWAALNKNGELQPYVDDTVDIINVNEKTGQLEGEGSSVYRDGKGYKILGRVSKQGLAHLFYTSPPPLHQLNGMLILKFGRSDFSQCKGWWLGAGREKGDVGGPVTFIRAEEYQGEWKGKAYDFEG